MWKWIKEVLLCTNIRIIVCFYNRTLFTLLNVLFKKLKKKSQTVHEKKNNNNEGVFSLAELQDKKLRLESRLRESFHVFRLSNRLRMLFQTLLSLLSHGRRVHSGENNESRVVGTSQVGQAQMCQGCWRWKQQSACQLVFFFLQGCDAGTCSPLGLWREETHHWMLILYSMLMYLQLEDHQQMCWWELLPNTWYILM